MPEEDLELQAGLDNTAVIAALEEMDKSADKFLKDADTGMQRLGMQTLETSKALKQQRSVIVDSMGSTVAATKVGEESIAELRKEITALGGDIKKAAAEAQDFSIGEDPSGEFFKELPKVEIDELMDTSSAITKIEELEEISAQLMQSISAEARQQGALIAASLDVIGNAKGPIEEVDEELRKLLVDAKRVAKGFGDIATRDVFAGVKTQDVAARLRHVRELVVKLRTSTSTSAQRMGDDLDKAATKFVVAWSKSSDKTGKSLETLDKNLKSLAVSGNRTAKEIEKAAKGVEATAKAASKAADEAAKKDIFGAVDTKKVAGRIKELQNTIERLKTSTSASAQKMGTELEKAAVKTVSAWGKGEKQIEEVSKDIRKLNSDGKETERIYGEKMPKAFDRSTGAVNRSTASVWKMSVALDRVGIRGVGGALRVVDAIKSIHPAAIIAVAGLVVVFITLKKIGEIAVQVAKKVGRFLADMTKDAVELAKSYETVELQLRNIFKGKEQLARQTLTRIMTLGAKLGVDLSGELSQVFLPLIENFEQFERLAQAAATLGVKTGKTMEETTRALAQAQAGQFRALQFQFKVTRDQIDQIKESQEELGATEGLIKGMEDYFEATGTGWDTFEDSLRRVQGQLIETFNLFKFQLGEPIKIALTEQLTGIRDWLEENEFAIKNFFRDIGESVGTAVTALGDFAQSFLDAVDPEDLDNMATSFQILAESIRQTFGDKSASDMQVWVDLLADLVLWLSGAVIELRQIAILTDLALTPPTGESFQRQREAATQLNEDKRALEELREELNKTKAERRALGEQDDESSKSEADNALAINALTERRSELMKDLIEQSKELGDAYKDLTLDLTRDLRDLGVEMSRRVIDIQIENSRKREDLARKHGDRLRDIAVKIGISVRKQTVNFSRQEQDIAIKNARKLIEIDIDEAKKKEQLEEKHQNRLKQIRDKFVFDAREAIRQNDAVAFFRLKRRLEFDLSQENKKHDESVRGADDAAQDKREKLDRQLKNEEEDLAKSNARKMQDIIQRLKDELKAEKQKHDDALELQQIEEKRKLEDLNLWFRQEREEYNTMLQDKLADLKTNMADQIQEYKDTLADVQVITSKIVQSMAQGMAATLGRLPFGNVFSSFLPGGFQQMLGIGGLAGGFQSPGTLTQPGVGGQATESQLRNLAVSLAKQLGKPTEYLKVIEDASMQGLFRIVDTLQKEKKRGGYPVTYKQHGGISNVGVPRVTGEAGPEAEFPAQAGIIAPHAPFMMPSQAQPNISTSVDNSRNISASIDLLDPTQVSEVQKTLWRSFVTEQLLAIEGGG